MSALRYIERYPWVLSLGLLLLIILWMLLPASSDSSIDDQSRNARAVQSVQVSAMLREPYALSLSLTGQTRASATARVSAELDARLEAFLIERGARVKKGDPLATLNTGSLASALSGVRAERSRAQLAYSTIEKLAAQGVSTGQEKAAAWAALQAARAREDEIKQEIGKSTIKAPFAGVVADLLVEQGDFVGIGQPAVLLVRLNPLIAAGEISERDVGAVTVGDSATVTLLGNRRLRGKVTYISPLANEATRTFDVEVSLLNSDRSVPVGMSSQIVIELETIMAHRLSPALLTLNASGEVEVATVDDSDTVALHTVDIIDSESDGVWVNGLPDGQRIITRGQGFVREGDLVRPVALDPSTDKVDTSGQRLDLSLESD